MYSLGYRLLNDSDGFSYLVATYIVEFCPVTFELDLNSIYIFIIENELRIIGYDQIRNSFTKCRKYFQL